MSTSALLRLFFILVIGLIAGWAVYTRTDPEENLRRSRPCRRYEPVFYPLLLPLVLISGFILLWMMNGFSAAAADVGSLLAVILPQLCVYYALLLALLPLLRRFFSPCGIAVLWILPNLLYLTANVNIATVEEPMFVLRLSASAARWLLILWAAGFLGVMTFFSIQHLVFRKELLRDAVLETDPKVLALFEHEATVAGLEKYHLKLFRAPRLTSPLSIGLFRRTLRVLLPESSYTEQELTLILRHELIHIRHADCCTKLFLTFCTALFWFNPLMWIAMRRCADDLELSCDELVLQYSDSSERRRYAELLLTTAGSGKGFTTCLSAQGQSLRYRLRNVLNPKKKWNSGILAGLLIAILLLPSGLFTVAVQAETVNAFRSCGLSLADAGVVYVSDGAQLLNCTDSNAVIEWVRNLEMSRLAGNYSGGEDDFTICLWSAENGYYALDFSGQYLLVTDYEHSSVSYCFCLSEAPDFTLVLSCTEPQQEDLPYTVPTLSVVLSSPDSELDGETLWAGYEVLDWMENGEACEKISEPSAGTIEGCRITAAELCFSDDPVSLYVTGTCLANGNADEIYDGYVENNTLNPPDYAIEYTIDAEFRNEAQDITCRVRYRLIFDPYCDTVEQ